MTPPTIKAARDIDKMHMQYRRDSEAIAAGIAAYRRSLALVPGSMGRDLDALGTIESLTQAVKRLDAKIDECDAARALLRQTKGDAHHATQPAKSAGPEGHGASITPAGVVAHSGGTP